MDFTASQSNRQPFHSFIVFISELVCNFSSLTNDCLYQWASKQLVSLISVFTARMSIQKFQACLSDSEKSWAVILK